MATLFLCPKGHLIGGYMHNAEELYCLGCNESYRMSDLTPTCRTCCREICVCADKQPVSQESIYKASLPGGMYCIKQDWEIALDILMQAIEEVSEESCANARQLGPQYLAEIMGYMGPLIKLKETIQKIAKSAPY